jgi:type VI secretion system secreted protein Hcp
VKYSQFFKETKMETKHSNSKVAVNLLVLAALCVFSLFAVAGNLEPSAAPGPTMHTLDEIYSAITQPSGGDISLPHHSDIEGSGVIHMTVTGETQGPILGSVTAAGKEGSILLTRIIHEVVQPRDAASGLPTGKRQHKPITITKEVDKSSAPLYNAFISSEKLTTIMFKFYRTGPSDAEELYFTIELEDAVIAAVNWDRGPEQMQHKEREQISFCYQKIIWTWTNDGGVTAQDNWETP